MLIVLILKYLAAELKEVRTMPCEQRAHHVGEAFRVDASADEGRVVIGGWRILESDKAAEASWFSVELTRATAPWAFMRGEPFRIIASTELLASLVGLMVLMLESDARSETAATITMTAGTDNQGNARPDVDHEVPPGGRPHGARAPDEKEASRSSCTVAAAVAER